VPDVDATAGPYEFRWLTLSPERLTLLSGICTPLELPHDESFHTAIAHDPRRHCGQMALVSALHISQQNVALEWVEAPYCRGRNGVGGARPIGWNFVLTVDDGTRAVVSFRHPSLASGGRWHLSANEGAEPRDITFVDECPERLHMGRIAARALYEELGLTVDAERLQDIVMARGVFEIRLGLGVFAHIPGEELAITTEQVLDAHRNAPDGWEGGPTVVDLTAHALAVLAPPSGWTEWGLPCLKALADPPRARN